MKKISFLLFVCAIGALRLMAQEYNTELYSLGQYVQRMYLMEPFEGARIVEDVDKCYLISVVAETPTNNDYATNRKAEVKGLSYANTFINGAVVSQNTVMYTKQNSMGYSFDEIEDVIESRSMGYIQTMQIISTFQSDQGKKVYVFCKQMPMPEKPAATKKSQRRK